MKINAGTMLPPIRSELMTRLMTLRPVFFVPLFFFLAIAKMPAIAILAVRRMMSPINLKLVSMPGNISEIR